MKAVYNVTDQYKPGARSLPLQAGEGGAMVTTFWSSQPPSNEKVQSTRIACHKHFHIYLCTKLRSKCAKERAKCKILKLGSQRALSYLISVKNPKIDLRLLFVLKSLNPRLD